MTDNDLLLLLLNAHKQILIDWLVDHANLWLEQSK